jgi:predicted transcriptional regulator
MLGLRLSTEEELRFERYAKSIGRPKSTLAREWIMQRLERESLSAEFRRQAASLAASVTPEEIAWLEAETDAWLRSLDEEDGGYDWGPEGPPDHKPVP